jgi:Ca-activated chloride channel homolog
VAFKHLLSGTVRDSLTWKGLQADILVLDAQSKRLIRKVTTDASGNYQVELPNLDKVYDVMAACDSYTKSRRKVKTEATAYQRGAYTSNFLLAKPADTSIEQPTPTQPPIAANQPKPPAKTEPAPQPEPEKERPALTQIKPQTGPGSLEPGISNQPEKVAPVVTEDMYSFEGVAENNLILLLDVSASMKKPEKLTLFKESFGKMLDHMRPGDQISIITYSGEVKLVLDGVSAIERQKIIHTIDNLRGAGSTQGKTALRRAYRTALDHYINGGNNRIVMATDGYFDIPELFSIAEKNAVEGINLSVLSFGKLNDLKHEELSTLAKKGKGNYAAVTPENVDEVLLREAKAVRK